MIRSLRLALAAILLPAVAMAQPTMPSRPNPLAQAATVTAQELTAVLIEARAAFAACQAERAALAKPPEPAAPAAQE